MEVLPLKEFFSRAAIASRLGVDTESNGEDVRDGRGYCQGISLAYRYSYSHYAVNYFPIRHKFGFNYDTEIRSDLTSLLEFRDENKFINVYHNSKYDIPSLRTAGIKLNYNNHYCTMLQSHLINENQFSASLQAVAKNYLGEGFEKQKSPLLEKIIKLYGWVAIPSEIMYEYALQDAALALAVHDKMQEFWDAENLDDYWFKRKIKTVDCFINMESHGVVIDQELCKRNIILGEEAMLDTVEQLQLNPGSTKDLSKLLLDELNLPVVKLTKNGNPSFDKEAMVEYDELLERRDDPSAIYILEYRGWQKSVSSNYKPYLSLLSPDGRLRPNYKLHGTKTGRNSCEKPNLQQIPRESIKPWNGGTKKAFLAKPGYSLIGLDYSQLEFRFGAAMAGQKKLIEIFSEDRDIFTEMSLDLGMGRFDTKTFTYSIQYGAGIRRIKNVFGISSEEAEYRISHYYETYPEFKVITKRAEIICKSKGKLQLWSGRYRHFMWPQSEGHKAFNSACQGGAADIVEDRMHALAEAGLTNTDDCKLLLHVHDELVFEINNEVLDSVVPAIKEVMENVQPDFGVKFKVEAKKWN